MTSGVKINMPLAELVLEGFFHPDALCPPAAYLVTGNDATRYLHGRLTQNVKALEEGQQTQSLMLTPNGRVQSICQVIKMSDGYLLIADTPPETDRTTFAQNLLQFRVSDDVQCELINFAVLTVTGARGIEILSSSNISKNASDPGCSLNTLGSCALRLFPATNLLVPFCQLLIQADHTSPIYGDLAALKLRQGSRELLEATRIASGVPKLGIDITERTQAADLPIENYASFTKGCYVGQEVVEMSSARGRPNRRWAKFVSTKITGLPLGTVGLDIATPDGRTVGAVSSVSIFAADNQTMALGFISSAVESPAQVIIDGEPFLESANE